MDRNTTRKRTIRIITAATLGLTLLGVAALSAQAGGPGRREPSPDRAVARLTERLDLTSDQEAQVRQILEESFAKRQQVWEQGRQQMEAIRGETDGKLSAVLTADQMEKLRELREKREHGFWGGEGRPCGSGCGHREP